MDLKRCDQCGNQQTVASAVFWYRLGRFVPGREEHVLVDLCSKECVRDWSVRLCEDDGQTFPAVNFGEPR